MIADGKTGKAVGMEAAWDVFGVVAMGESHAKLPVAVKDFVGQVKETPPESTLKALYEQYKSFEPAPSRQLPGFKEPRSVRIEYVSASPDDPFYREQARQQVKLLAGPLPKKVLPWSNPFSRASAVQRSKRKPSTCISCTQ